jgi:hypothetical protein
MYTHTHKHRQTNVHIGSSVKYWGLQFQLRLPMYRLVSVPILTCSLQEHHVKTDHGKQFTDTPNRSSPAHTKESIDKDREGVFQFDQQNQSRSTTKRANLSMWLRTYICFMGLGLFQFWCWFNFNYGNIGWR